MREEACATITHARLLGFGRGACVSGPEEGLVLVRSQWRAEVTLQEWQPLFEICYRKIVPASEWQKHLWIDEGFAPIFSRLFAEAGLVQ
jgi:hypothetical protein